MVAALARPIFRVCERRFQNPHATQYLAARLAALAALFAALLAPAAAADRREKATDLVRDASETAAYFAADTAFEALWNLAGSAKAVVIIPQKIRAGFVFGGAAGNGAMIARNKDGTWSEPTFLTIGSFSFGFQAGGEASEIVLLVMTNRGMEALLSTNVKLGADISIAAGPVGAGAKAQTTDVLAFSRSRGLYGGVSLEGAILKTRRNWNKAYYNADVSPAEIIFKQEVSNPASTQLKDAVWRLANKKSTATPPPAGAAGPAGDQAAPAPEGAPLAPPAGEDGVVYEDDEAWGAPIERP